MNVLEAAFLGSPQSPGPTPISAPDSDRLPAGIRRPRADPDTAVGVSAWEGKVSEMSFALLVILLVVLAVVVVFAIFLLVRRWL
jgi:hypothetical protein